RPEAECRPICRGCNSRPKHAEIPRPRNERHRTDATCTFRQGLPLRGERTYFPGSLLRPALPTGIQSRPAYHFYMGLLARSNSPPTKPITTPQPPTSLYSFAFSLFPPRLVPQV